MPSLPGQGQIRVLIQHSGAVSNLLENSMMVENELEALRTLEEVKTGLKNVFNRNLSEHGCFLILREFKHFRVQPNSAEFHAKSDAITIFAARAPTSDVHD